MSRSIFSRSDYLRFMQTYREPANSNQPYFAFSHFGRNRTPLTYLGHMHLPKNPRVLCVGPGVDMPEKTWCASEPFEVAAMLQNSRRNYTMTIMDTNKAALDSVRRREKIFANLANYYDVADWLDYLLKTLQDPSRHGHEDKSLEPGYAEAGIPESFIEKLKSGEITLIHDDIITADLKSRKFDMVLCWNMHSAGDEYSAMTWNISRHMAQNGVFATDDYHDYDEGDILFGEEKIQKLDGEPFRLVKAFRSKSFSDLIYSRA